MRLISLMLSGFRSWETVTFPFLPGLTVLGGKNGAGKSSLRLGVQYAIYGRLPGFHKNDLMKIGGAAPMSVTLKMETDEGVPCVMRRAGSRVSVKIGDQDFSIREPSYLAKFKEGLNYAFLSPDQVAFVDVIDSKRKELLYGLIPEVSVLRSQCVPRFRTAHKRLFEKRINIGGHIQTMETVISETHRLLRMAEQRLLTEQERIRILEESANRHLPLTMDKYRELKEKIADIGVQEQAHLTYQRQASSWLDHAAYTNALNMQSINLLITIENEHTKVGTQIAAVRDIMDTAEKNLICPHCQEELSCGQCGTVIENKDAIPPDLAKKLANLEAKKEQLTLDYEQQKQANTKLDIVESAEIARVEGELRVSREALQIIRDQREEIRKTVHNQEVVMANIEEIRKIHVDQQNIQAIEDEIEQITADIAAKELRIARKKKTLDVMDNLDRDLEFTIGLMNTTLPAIYFDNFLTKLTTYCNYLLKAISDMSIYLRASEDGISIVVDNKKFHQLSTGQKQRVRVATTLAFSLMTKQSDTLFVDEIFDAFMDEEGIAALAELLSTVMQEFYPKIIIVSHQANLLTSLNPDHIVLTELDDTKTSHMTIRSAASAV